MDRDRITRSGARAPDLDAMSNHSAFAVLANRRNRLNCALEAIESVTNSGGYQFETLVVLVSTNLTGGHTNLLLMALCSRCRRVRRDSLDSAWAGVCQTIVNC